MSMHSVTKLSDWQRPSLVLTHTSSSNTNVLCHVVTAWKSEESMKARLIDLPKIVDPRGNLTVAEQNKNIPFDIARVYWTYDVPSGERRGGHAHRTCEEIVIAVSGSFDVTVDDGRGGKEIYHLNHPYQGLYIGTGIWRTLEDFSSGAVCLVLASELFDEDEYIYEYDEFQDWVKRND